MGPLLRIVFMGSDGIALKMLEHLVGPWRDRVAIVGVFTQPDRPVGRGQKVQANAIKQWALDQGIPVFQPDRITPEVLAQLAGLAPDLSVVMAYGHILKDDFIAVPRLGTINLHASLLPAYRGASPIQTAIAEGETRTGVSLMRIVRRLDAGPVADREAVRIEETDTALEIEEKLASACVPLMDRNLAALSEGDLGFVVQDDAQATFCRKLTKEDGVIDWRKPARLVAARINGLYPWPGCTFNYGDQRIKVGRARAETSIVAAEPGTLIDVGPRLLRVACGDGATVELLQLQRPGGKMLPTGEFLRGFSFALGDRLESFDLSPLVATEPFKVLKKG